MSQVYGVGIWYTKKNHPYTGNEYVVRAYTIWMSETSIQIADIQVDFLESEISGLVPWKISPYQVFNESENWETES